MRHLQHLPPLVVDQPFSPRLRLKEVPSLLIGFANKAAMLSYVYFNHIQERLIAVPDKDDWEEWSKERGRFQV